MKLTKEHKRNARELVEFYTKMQDADELTWAPGGDRNLGPNLYSDLAQFELIAKPKPLPADLSVLIKSGIDCEFSNDPDFSRPLAGKLGHIRAEAPRYGRAGGLNWEYCRPRMNHIHAWIPTEDSECPLPEGFRIKVYFRGGEVTKCRLAERFDWSSEPVDLSQIIAFEVLPDLEPGYCWPWEVEEDHE